MSSPQLLTLAGARPKGQHIQAEGPRSAMLPYHERPVPATLPSHEGPSPAMLPSHKRQAHQLGLLHQCGTVLAHSIHHAHGGCPPEAGLGLASHQQGVHQGLGVVLANAHQQVMDQAPHRLHCCVDAGYHLQAHSKAGCRRLVLVDCCQRHGCGLSPGRTEQRWLLPNGVV